MPDVIAVTTPVAAPTLTLALVLDHVPPVVVLCNTDVAPGQTLKVPYIAVSGLTVVTTVAMQPAPNAE